MATAEEAQKYVQSKNSRNRPTIPAVVTQMVNGPTIKIFNIYDKSHIIGLGSLGTFTIPACEKGQNYSNALEIKAAYIDEYPYDMDLNGTKTTYNVVDGVDVAEEVIGISAHKDQTANLTRWGVFVAAGDKPTSAELDAAKAALTKTMIALVAEADGFAMQGPLKADQIVDHHRKAAAFLNQQREWATVSGQRDICPACGESINLGVAICRHCDAVLDDARAKQFRLGPYRNVSVTPTPENEPKQAKK